MRSRKISLGQKVSISQRPAKRFRGLERPCLPFRKLSPQLRQQASDLRNAVFLNLAIVPGGLHSMITRWVYFLIWPIRGCASGQSIASVEDLDRARHTRYKQAISKKHLISANRNIHPTSFE